MERRGGGGGAAHAHGPAARAERGAPRGAATMEGGAYGAGKAGGAFDPYTLVRQPHTILRVVSWVRTQQGGLGRGAPGIRATSPGPSGPADTCGSRPLPPSSSAPSPRPPGCRCSAFSSSVRSRPWGRSLSSRPLIGGRGSGRGSFSRAHCCTCRALSGRGPGTRFLCSPCTLRSSESGALDTWVPPRPASALPRDLGQGATPEKIRDTRDSVPSWVGSVTSYVMPQFLDL